jgi:MYXO-CTERM domain-containing protein
LGACLGLGVAATASAAGSPKVVQNPNFEPRPAPVIIDFSPDAPVEHRPRIDRDGETTVEFSQLDAYRRQVDVPAAAELGTGALPAGMTQLGGMVVPTEMTEGADMVADAQLALTVGELPVLPGFIDDVCAFPDEVPPGIYDYDYRPGMELPRFHTVFLNFMGATLSTGGENAAENLSGIALSGHPFPVYAGGTRNAIAVAQAVAMDLEAWAIDVVYLERPPKVLPYSMAMIGGSWSDTTAGPSGGVAPLDCEDFGQRNVCYAFQNNAPVSSQANVASQEIGHTMGLEHSSAPDSVMALGYSMTQAGDLGFNGDCAVTVSASGQGTGCNGVNRCHCGDPDLQHERSTLSAIFSPAGLDITPPTIDILTPADGEHFAPEDTVVVSFDPWDDVGGYGWKLIVTDETGEVLVDQVDYERALEFMLAGLPNGQYTLTALIVDHGGHETTDTVTITIGPEEGGTAGSGGSDDGLDSTAGASADSGDAGTDADSDETGADTAGQSVGDDGCGCAAASGSSGGPRAGYGLLLGLLGLCGLRRRRLR